VYVYRPAVVRRGRRTGRLIWVNRDRFTPLDVGSRAPDYAAVTLDGDTVAAVEFPGRRRAAQHLGDLVPAVRPRDAGAAAAARGARRRGLRIVAVSVDAPPALIGARSGRLFGGDVREFADRFGLTFTVLHDPSGGSSRATR
jgi:hypothetical protein